MPKSHHTGVVAAILAATVSLGGCVQELTQLCSPPTEEVFVAQEFTQCVRFEGEICTLAVQVRLLENPQFESTVPNIVFPPQGTVLELVKLYRNFTTTPTRR